MTTCQHPGALRAALDGERPDLVPHVAGCADCSRATDQLAADARHTETAIALLGDPPPVDVDAALARRPVPAAVTQLAPRRDAGQRRAWASRAAAAVLVVMTGALVVATPTGRAAATAVLDRFRSERLAPITLDPMTVEVAALETLSEVAVIEGLDGYDGPEEVATVDEASRIAGITVEPLQPLPAELAGQPVSFLASAPRQIRVTLDASRAAELPAVLDGAVLVVDVPGAVGQVVGSDDGPLPALVSGTSGPLVVNAEGDVSLSEIRDALLALPGLPPETVAQLRTLDDWERTLPIPVPPGIAWQDTTVAGHPALQFSDSGFQASALAWNTGEEIRVVAGTQPIEVLRRVAESGS